MLFSRYLSVGEDIGSAQPFHAVNAPLLVFLHGFLGSTEDWSASLPWLANFPRLTIDLPGFGLSSGIHCQDFSECLSMVNACIASQLAPNQQIVLMGYSMGGRMIMRGLATGDFDDLPLLGAVIEGGHYGLQDQTQKEARLANDEKWAARFEQEPIEQVLFDWYQQSVFSSLNHDQRQKLVAIRSANLGSRMATMLRMTSLAHQGYLLPALHQQSVPIRYLIGERDIKFRQLAAKSSFPVTLISGAGHNVHHECPQDFAQALTAVVESL
ncbi:2-succinyl-6-hydroxy-2,4-cyclohexadiene-1-carboxylate synthase [Vibrio sp. FNV 38]|nr:2-succinyl-6-hydroxy-2,4-cyclohexadiene-1-carboxylate synthase [Vibrio sp. FNV 38]